MDEEVEQLWRRVREDRDEIALLKLASLIERRGMITFHIIRFDAPTIFWCGASLYVCNPRVEPIHYCLEAEVVEFAARGHHFCRRCIRRTLKRLCKTCRKEADGRFSYCERCKPFKDASEAEIVAEIAARRAKLRMKNITQPEDKVAT